MKTYILGFLIVFSLLCSGVGAEEGSDPHLNSAMAAGASANVLSEASIDYVTGSNASQDPWWKRALKRAMSGAATGAAATKSAFNQSEEDPIDDSNTKKSTDKTLKNQKAHKEIQSMSKDKTSQSKKDKDEFRPPGWDKGKKKGWGDRNTPPGLSN